MVAQRLRQPGLAGIFGLACIVATAEVGEAGTAVPMRLTATLAPEAGRDLGAARAREPPLAVELARLGDRLEVGQTPTPDLALGG